MVIDEDTRRAILALTKKGKGLRAIATSLGLGRNTVRRIVRSGGAEHSRTERDESLTPHDKRIRELFTTCEGSRQRVHEELAREDVPVPYATLTAYCRRHGIGVLPKKPAGQYTFEPGEEQQHDTSPHKVKLGGRIESLHCASLVLCYSRRRYCQLYPRWTRFWAKVFLTEALVRFGGSCAKCMLDNASIVVASGSGKDAVMAPEMAAFGKRFGFEFVAHELGDANRSAHVERGFDYVEKNFYRGRTFASLADANAQLVTWCDADDMRPRKRLGSARPIDLFVAERPALKPLPLYVPEPSQRWDRRVDTEGYVHLHSNRYSAPLDLLEHDVVVYETKDRVRLFKGLHEQCAHERFPDGAHLRSMLPAHEAERRGARLHNRDVPRPEEARLRAASPALGQLISALKKRHGGRATRVLQRLDRMWKEYPIEPLAAAIEHAMAHGLYDLGRIERIVLQRIAGDYFQLPLEGMRAQENDTCLTGDTEDVRETNDDGETEP
jgi:transposase